MADYIISQTEDLQAMLLHNHGLNSTVISNPLNIPAFLPEGLQFDGETPTVLWIGRSESFNKRPELLVEIAVKLPNIHFLMILNNVDDELFRRINQTKPENVEIVEYVSPDKMNDVFAKSSIFISTSSKDYEGFPNVFLHAIAHGVPIVSLDVDPDGIFSRHGCGICCDGDIDIAIRAIEKLLHDKQRREEIIQRAFNYIKEKHSTEIISKQMIDFFTAISLEVKNQLKWAGYSFNRLFEQLPADYKQLQASHNALLNHLAIRILNKLRKVIGKEVWR
jgi:glycosyltransferase involved in cell wall biosynthesis